MNTNNANKINAREEIGKKLYGSSYKKPEVKKQVVNKQCTTPIPNPAAQPVKPVQPIIPVKKPESKRTEPNDSLEECGSDYFNWYSVYCYIYYNCVEKSVSPSKYIEDMLIGMKEINKLIKNIICGLKRLNSTLEKSSKISAMYDKSFVLNTIDREHPHLILSPESLDHLLNTVTDKELLDNIVKYGKYLYSILTVVRYSSVDNIIAEHHLTLWKYKPQKVESLISDLERLGFKY